MQLRGTAVRKKIEEEPDWEAEGELGSIGVATTVTEVPPKRRQKIYRRRIGFLVDIDELIEAE